MRGVPARRPAAAAVVAEAAVHARGVAVGWHGRAVVEGIDLVVPPGTSLALVGTNGSGKSTLLRTLVGLQPSLAGTLRVLGARPGAAPARVGYVGQFHPRGFVLPLRAADVVAMGRFARRGLLGRPARGDGALVRRALSRMDAAHLADAPLRELSGGQQQRVYVAQALAAEADLLVLDEPASGLDPSAREVLQGALDDERARGAAVVTATHDIRDALAADQALLLAGRVVAAGPPARALTRDAVMETFGLVLTDLLPGVPIAVDPGHAHGAHDPEHR
ncbi:MAG TPA: ATP-binding cassette domain-containing protein [Miltoncostaeaceae bacterium]|nr:ATP-binding cassette domain-containing protein [Miltoncostaeaceae bacterium]